MCLVYAGSIGYQGEFLWSQLLMLAGGILVGIILRRSNNTHKIFRRSALLIPLEILELYAISIVWVGVAYGIGYGIMELMKFEPVI